MDDDDAARARLERLWADHADAVLGYAVLRTDRADAEEVVGEVFTVAWRRLDDVPEQARPWLLGVARKVLANARRGHGRRLALTERLAERAQVAAPSDTDPAESVAERLRLVAALRRLDERDREVLVLAGVHGLAPPAVAQVLGCTTPTASVRLHRARRRLRAALAAVDGDVPHADAPRAAHPDRRADHEPDHDADPAPTPMEVDR